MVQEKDQLTNKNQAQSSKDIGNRVADIDFWKSELRHETDLLVGETNALTEVIHRLCNIVYYLPYFLESCFMNLAPSTVLFKSQTNRSYFYRVSLSSVLRKCSKLNFDFVLSTPRHS